MNRSSSDSSRKRKGCGEEAVRAAVNDGVTAFAQEWLALEEAGWA